MATIREEIKNLKTADIFSLLLFVLYKIRNIEEYSTISELAYVLDKNNLIKLCEYFGGMTIKVPTIDELENLINSMLLYQYINVDGYSYNEAIKLIGFDSTELRKVKKEYNKISEVLDNYTVVERHMDEY